MTQPAAIEPLGPHEAHVWFVQTEATEDPALVARYQALLAPTEQLRQQRFLVPAPAHEHLVTRALVRTTLSRYAPVAPTDWCFEPNRYGRPEIVAPVLASPLCFNLSNTRGLVACIVTRDRECGIDVEDLERDRATDAIGKRFFAAAEVAAFLAQPEERRPDTFFRYWTLKEAYIKARGMGLALPLGAFAFDLDARSGIRISFDERIDDDASSWQFLELVPTPRHRMAIALRRREEPDVVVLVRETVPLSG